MARHARNNLKQTVWWSDKQLECLLALRLSFNGIAIVYFYCVNCPLQLFTWILITYINNPA
jgi:hypothetical protein